MASRKPDEPKRRGRPITRNIKLNATPEQAARAIFSAVKPPDPSQRIGKTKQVSKGNRDVKRNT